MIRKIYEDEFLNKVIRTIDDNNMIKHGDGIVVALSGGPDSISLLHALYSLKERYGIRLYAAHVNHMLRGEDSEGDESTCRAYCEELGIEFYSRRCDIEKVSLERGISTEMAGREVRYEFFEEVMKNQDARKIAIAHNMNDQAETILMRLMRGTGIEGLVGIKPIRDEIFIRPIIKIKRQEIEEYCKKNNLPVRIDKTNLKPIYSRNKVRLELIPYIEDNFNSDIISALSRMGDLIKQDEEYIQENAVKVFQKYCYIREEKVIIYKDVFSYHPSIVSRVLRKAILEFKGNINNVQSIHIDNIVKVQQGDTGKKVELPGDLIVTNEYKNLVLTKKTLLKGMNDFNFDLDFGRNYIASLGICINIKRIEEQNINLISNNDKKYFAIDGVRRITLRNRQEGDRFSPLGMKGSKKLKDIFIDLKIPREKRDTIPLLCFDQDISWIMGYKISEKYKVNNKANNIIEVSVERQENHE